MVQMAQNQNDYEHQHDHAILFKKFWGVLPSKPVYFLA